MRNPSRRFAVLGLSLFLSTSLLGSDLLSEPASAHPRKAATTQKRQKVRYRTRRPARPPLTVAAFGGDPWAALRHCESSGRYHINTGNGYYGAYQFLPATWRSLGYTGLPHHAPPAVQDEAAQRLQARSGWGQWPACSRRLGLR